MDKAFTEDDFGLTVTLSYTILEGVFKAYINDQIQEAITSDQIISMSKKVRDHITSLTPSEYPPQLITLISTVTHAVAEARNSFSDSHFDKAAEASIAQICRDSVNSITRFILYFLK